MSKLYLEQLPHSSDSLSTMSCFVDWDYPVFLDSGSHLSAQSRYDIISAAPITTLRTDSDSDSYRTRIQHLDTVQYSEDPPLQILQSMLAQLCTEQADSCWLPFIGGALGIFSYDLGRQFERIPAHAAADIPAPVLFAGIYLWAIVQDHQLKQTWLVAQPSCSPAVLSKVKDCIARAPCPIPHTFKLRSPFSKQWQIDEYEKAFFTIQDYIRDGDCYQVNLAQRFSTDCDGSSWAAYQAVREQLHSPFSAYLDLGDMQVLSFSPERFLKVQNGWVETKPIKGTRPRSHNSHEDQNLKRQLESSLKDRAENLMIVDLLRNDLGRCCVPGSVSVEKLFAIESFTNVHHMVSTIRGKLSPEESALSLLQACFPGGSITGAPKIRAMEIIEELEPCRRGFYCGSIICLSADGRLDSNITIRTVLRHGENIYCWGGGGIVSDSQCSMEYQESIDKIQPILSVLESL